MKKIRIFLEYGCSPVWLYDEDGDLIDNDLPNELASDRYINMLCDDITEQFDGLFINTTKEFDYIGDQHPDIEKILEKKLKTLETALKIRLGKNYIIQLE